MVRASSHRFARGCLATADVCREAGRGIFQLPLPPVVTNFHSHGLSIRDIGRGISRLLVVGHGAREAIEVFDVAAGADGPSLTWRGCVPMPNGLAANSVASFADGSIVATVLLMPGRSFTDSVEKRPTGAVFEWTPGSKGFVQVIGTDLPGNNGIEVSPDGREFYVVSSGLQTVVAFSHSNPARQLRSTRPLPFTPDNIHRGPDGRLFTAGMANDVPECWRYTCVRDMTCRGSPPARAAPSRQPLTRARSSTNSLSRHQQFRLSATQRWSCQWSDSSGWEHSQATVSPMALCVADEQ